MKKSNSFKLIIPDEVEKKIRFICQQVWKDEWSGTLFYTPEGSFEDGTLIIRCVDIYVMDIGNATYTEFDMSPDVISYMTENPDLLDCQTGLIHSHCTMPTFFSSTDTNTLKEEGLDRNHFVSLIVNNEGTYTAAITRLVKSTKSISDNFSYPTFNNNIINDTKTYTSESEELEWFNLNIEFEKNDSFREVLKDRLDEIKKIKQEKERRKNFTPYPGYSNWQGKTPIQGSLFQNQSQKSTKDFQPYKPYSIKNLNPVKKVEEGTSDFDWDFIDNKIKEEEYYKNFKFDKKIIKSLVLQLITGSIVLPNESKIDAKKWAKGMVPIFKKRFGDGKEGIKMFTTWAEGYIEYLCWYTNDDALNEQCVNDDEMASLCAEGMIEELKKLPTNEYIKIYIDILEGYII